MSSGHPIIDIVPLADSEAALRDVGRQSGVAGRGFGVFHRKSGPVSATLRAGVFAAAHSVFAADAAGRPPRSDVQPAMRRRA